MLALALAAAAAVYTNTETVEAIDEHDGSIWVTTTGGVEQYDAGTLERVDVAPATAHPAAVLEVAPRYQGARETVRADTSAGTLVGTAGAGVWLDGAKPRRLTPTGQICGNHVVAIAEWKGHTWVTTFDAGVCWLKGDRWITPKTSFRMGNDMAVTSKGLVVAAGEGLFVSKNGKAWKRWAGIADKGFNDLAVAGHMLYATTPGSLWRIELKKKRKPRSEWLPGTSRAVQSVAAAGGAVWISSEDKGALQRADDGTYTIWDRAAGLPSSWILDVALVGADLWLATLRHGLVHRDATGAWTRIAGVESTWGLTVAPDADATGVWYGAQDGLYHVAADGTVTASDVALPDPNVHGLLADGADLWVGTEGGLVQIQLG
jgi:ligand-binding sensor domain-containing protein